MAEQGSAKAPDTVMTRVFDARRELVFKVWTDPKHLVRWWGPRGFTLPVCEVDLRAGGIFRFVMRGPDGKDYGFEGKYLEIVEPERLVFEGAIHGDPSQNVMTVVTFADEQGKTRLTVRQSYSFESDATRGSYEGWKQSLDCLGEYLATI